MWMVWVAAPAGPATARAATAASARNSLRIGKPAFHRFDSCASALSPAAAKPKRTPRSVLLTAIMSLQRPHSRALVAGGTGRVGHAIVERLRADGWTVIAAGRSDGDLRTRDGAVALVE